MNASPGLVALLLALPTWAAGAEPPLRPDDPAAVRAFLAAGFGSLHEKAPEPTRQFAQLVGLWDVTLEMRRRDGSWAGSWPAVWAWKHALDGFAIQDLFAQPADRLPPYLSGLGRDYVLTAMRLYDVRAGHWSVAWMANGGGATPGQDFGTFEARADDGRIVMTSAGPSAMAEQRIVFSRIEPDSFLWESQFSGDGGDTWQTVMRLEAVRREAP